MRKIHPNAAGIDIGSTLVFAAVEGQEVKSFATFTSDLIDLAHYLKENGVETVAMEATGVYWFILYDILVDFGFDVWLVDGRQTKQAPGRKTDVKDSAWIQELHSYGLLTRCFVGDINMKELRGYQRIREDHIRSAAMHINHMQKALIAMNIRLPEVLSQIHGASGIAMIQAIIAGEKNPHKLLELCSTSLIKAKKDIILKALEGKYTSAGLFSLEQAYTAYCFYQEQIKACDKKINEVLSKINDGKGNHKRYNKKKRKPIRHHKPQVNDLGNHLLHLFDGKDATCISGITDYTWLQLYSETGNDLLKWPSEKHFTSWLGLAPGQNNSGKRKRNVRKGHPKAGQIFRQIAQALLNSNKIAWGEFARRIKGRKGPHIAIKATARKIAVQYWMLMVKGSGFVEKGIEDYQQKIILNKHKFLRRLATELNFDIQPVN